MKRLSEAAGGLAEVYSAVEWAAGPLGDPGTWSPTLRAAVELTLHTDFPVTLLWGPDLVMVYNEAYIALIGDKHPAALGSPACEVFTEAWEQIGPWLRAAYDGRTTYVEDELVPLERHGFLEDCYFTFSYSLVGTLDDPDRGVIDIATETTASVVIQRRLRLLGRLAGLLAGVENPLDVTTQALLFLREATDDLAAVGLRPGPFSEGDDGLPDAPSSPVGRRDLLVDEHPDGPVVWLGLRTTTDERPVEQAGPASAVVPPVLETRPLLVVRPSPRVPLDLDHLVFLRLVAAALTQALDRVEALAAERRVAAAEREMSETLQRSLLGAPQEAPGCRVAVRYQPAADLAEVGGDWHDSFLLPDGRLCVAIGDVAGHDRQAAAAMAQTRNLLRGIAYTGSGSPAAALTALDGALDGLGVGSFATGILATLDAVDDGVRRLTWSNAGHPSPVLLSPDGTVSLLRSEPELLLGVRTHVDRTDHTVDLLPGSIVLLLTDGLIERRSRPLDEGLDLVVEAISGMAHVDPEELCDHVLRLADRSHDDDIALLCLRVH